MTARRGGLALVLTALAGAALVAGARLSDPWAPPLYEGILTGSPAYAYCSPPPALASSNKLPTAGSDVLQFSAGVNAYKVVETSDKQALVYFPAHAVNPPATGNTLRVDIVPLKAPPPPPPGASNYVGEAFLVGAVGAEPNPLPAPCDPVPGALPNVPLAMAAQVLMRVPPVNYNNVRLYYAGTWHPVTWGAQQDFANAAIDHFGVLAAFNDPGKAPSRPHGGFPIAVLEVGLTVAAILVIVGGVVVSRVQAGRARK